MRLCQQDNLRSIPECAQGLYILPFPSSFNCLINMWDTWYVTAHILKSIQCITLQSQITVHGTLCYSFLNLQNSITALRYYCKSFTLLISGMAPISIFCLLLFNTCRACNFPTSSSAFERLIY